LASLNLKDPATRWPDIDSKMPQHFRLAVTNGSGKIA
jgi:hypothetical protein